MSTVTPLVVRMGTLTVRSALSTIFAAVAMLAILTCSFAAPPSANAADDSCPSVEVVFARGTFEAPGVGATGQAFVDALNARLPGKTVDVYGVNYPASLDFGRPPTESSTPATGFRSIATSCPNTKIVLGGYSQGAAVAGYTTADAVPDGFALPDGLQGPMPACDRLTRRRPWCCSVRPTPGVLNLLDRQCAAHHHRSALRREDDAVVCNRRSDLLPRRP